MRKAIFITVRTGSTRLPKKCLLEIKGLTTIQHLIRRIKKAKMADVVVLCTTYLEEDNVLEEIAKKENIECFRGSVKDKLERWRGAAEKFHVDFFVTADGDDLFCEPELIDLAFEQAGTKTPDFIKGDGVEGVDVPVGAFTYGIKTKALQTVCKIKDTDDTEMMWTYFEDTGLFDCQKLENVPRELKRPKIRMTLDYPDDFKFFETVIEALGVDVHLRDIIEYLDKHPEIVGINQYLQDQFRANQKAKTRLLLKGPTVLFYTSIPRIFRSTLLGYLHEISQVYPVVLLSEKLDEQTEAILRDKSLFPTLKEIIPVSQYPKASVNILLQNRYLSKKAKEVVKKYNPDIVVTANDVFPFELYLQRAAKKIGAATMCFQGGYRTAGKREVKAWAERVLGNSQFKKMKKHLGYMVYYWFLPLLAGGFPFGGKSSFIRLEDDTGFRVDWSVVFAKRDYEICVQDGVPKGKLLILGHPMRREAKSIFEAAYGKHVAHSSQQITFLLPTEEVGVRKQDLSIIPPEEIWDMRRKIITVISETLPGWQIWVKPHPSMEDLSRARKELESIASTVEVVNALEPVDKYIAQSKIVVGIPADSTALFTASLQSPETVVISADLHGELLGDSFKNTEGIEYVHAFGQLKELLESVREGRYEKKSYSFAPDSFGNAAAAVAYAYKQNIHG